jgi:probable HAF family extracellular repeat protein
VNADDIVVGESDAGDGTKHAFFWRDGRIFDLNDLVAPDSTLLGGESYTLASATAINDKGDAVLWARTGSGRYAPLLLKLDRLSEIKPPASWGAILSAESLKEDGSFAGSFKTPDGHEEGFVFSHGRFDAMGTLSGDSRAYAVNARGVAVGESQADDGTHAVLWRGQGLVDLNALFDDEARTVNGVTFRLASATGIDAQGRIVGVAWENAALPHDAVFILTPSRGLGVWAWLAIAFCAVAAAAIALFAYAHPARFAELATQSAALARRSVPAPSAANASAVVSLLGHWLLGIAVFEMLALLALWLFGAVPPTVFADPLVYGLCGAFLIRRRSRAVAIVALVYSILVLALTLSFPAGAARLIVQGLGALAALHASWQAVRATILDGHARRLKIRWANVVVIAGATLAGFVVLCIAFTYGARLGGLNTANSTVTALVAMLAGAIALFAVMAPLSARRPFAQS